MIDLHAHILPGIDDGPRTLEESLEMARMAVAEGITTMVATPHLFRRRTTDFHDLIDPDDLRRAVRRFNEELGEAEIGLIVVPGCEIPLFPDIIKFIDDHRVVTINDGQRYICLEMPDSVIPPATENIIFELSSRALPLSSPTRSATRFFTKCPKNCGV